jgi:hypothetical protein
MNPPPDKDAAVQDTKSEDDPVVRLGNAAATGAGDKSAMKWANTWLSENEGVESIANITETHVEGNNMRRILRAMLSEFANSNVPYSRGGGYLKADSKQTYVSKIKEEFCHRFTKHEFWNEIHDGWSALLEQFNHAAKRFDQMGGRSTSSTKAMPIYKSISDLPMGAIAMQDIGVLATDLKGILMGLLAAANNRKELSAGLYQKRLELIFCKNADGRGGEHFLLKWTDAYWDYRFDMPIFTWELQNQIDDQVMVFAPKLFSETAYVTDMFHAMGCYFIMERGAANKMRDPCIRSFVFPDLHSKRSDYVAKALSAALKKGVMTHYPQLPTDHVKQHTSRGLRVATNSELALHPQVTPDQRIFMGGWSHHKNGDGYLKSSPAMVMSPALALAGRNNVSVTKENLPHPPALSWLGSSANPSIGMFLSQICKVDVPQLEPFGNLRRLFDACIATLNMYHSCMKKDFGCSDRVCSRLEDVAEAVQIKDAAFPEGTSPKETLLEWGKILQKKYIAENADRPGLSEDVKAHISFLTDRVDSCLAVSTAAVELTKELQATMLEMQKRDLQKTKLLERYAKDQEKSMEIQNNLVNVLLKTVGTLDGLKANEMSPRKRKAIQAKIMGGILQTNVNSIPPVSSMTPHSANTNENEVMEITESSAANWKIEDILSDCLKSGSLKGMNDPTSLANLCCPIAISKEKAKFKNCMDLMSLCFSTDSWKLVCGDYEEKDDLEKAKATIKDVCMVAKEYMLRLELDSGTRDSNIVKDQGKRVKMTVTGLGERYRKWKVKVGEGTVEATRLSKLKENGFMGGNGKKRQRQSQLSFVPKKVPAEKENGTVIYNPYKKSKK